jgi:hypothetical protein
MKRDTEKKVKVMLTSLEIGVMVLTLRKAVDKRTKLGKATVAMANKLLKALEA